MIDDILGREGLGQDPAYDLLRKIQLLLRRQLDSINNHDDVEQYLERNERACIIKELIVHLQFLRQLRNDASPKQTSASMHPTFMEEVDRILEEVSVLLQTQAQHIDDLANPHARGKFEERKRRIEEL
jgi:hypothetical protein